MMIVAFIEIRPICRKVLWFPTGTVIGASKVDDEDIWKIYTYIWEQLEVYKDQGRRSVGANQYHLWWWQMRSLCNIVQYCVKLSIYVQQFYNKESGVLHLGI